MSDWTLALILPSYLQLRQAVAAIDIGFQKPLHCYYIIITHYYNFIITSFLRHFYNIITSLLRHYYVIMTYCNIV